MEQKTEEPPKYPEVAARLAQFIKDSGELNQRQFAIRAGLTPQKISYILQGKFLPGGDTMTALADTYRDFDAIWLLTGRRTIGVTPSEPTTPATSKDTEKPEAAAVPVISAVPSDYGTTVEIAINRARLADKDILIEQQRVEIARLNRELGKPFNGLDAAGPEPTPTPRNPIGFALSVSRRVKMNGAARPL